MFPPSRIALKDYYFALGPADVVVIYEAPDAITAASVSMMLGASGASSSVETIQLFTMEDALMAMTKAGQMQERRMPLGRVEKPIFWPGGIDTLTT